MSRDPVSSEEEAEGFFITVAVNSFLALTGVGEGGMGPGPLFIETLNLGKYDFSPCLLF